MQGIRKKQMGRFLEKDLGVLLGPNEPILEKWEFLGKIGLRQFLVFNDP